MIKILTPPTGQAVLLEDLKAYMRITHAMADQTLGHTLKAAQEYLETQLGLKLMDQTVRMTCSGWRMTRSRVFRAGKGMQAHVRLPVAPVKEVAAVWRVFETGKRTEVPKDELKWHTCGVFSDLCIETKDAKHLEVDAVVGFGTLPKDVPAPLRMAILMLAQSYFSGGREFDLKGLKLLLMPFLKRGV